MEQDTNVSMDVELNDGSDLFMDYAEDTNPEPAEEQAPEEATEAAEQTTPEPQTHKVKFLGQEKELTYEELVTFAQKGLNADHALEKMANSRENQLLDKLAARMGVTREQYLDIIEKNQRDADVKKSADALAKKYPDLPTEAASEMGQMAAELERYKNAEKDAAAEKAKREEAEKPMREFVEYLNTHHPDAEFTKDVTKLPEPVLKDIRAGKDPTRAMMEYEIAESAKQLKELQDKLATAEKVKAKNEQNKKQSIGSVTGNAGEGELDAFLSGLSGG